MIIKHAPAHLPHYFADDAIPRSIFLLVTEMSVDGRNEFVAEVDDFRYFVDEIDHVALVRRFRRRPENRRRLLVL